MQRSVRSCSLLNRFSLAHRGNYEATLHIVRTSPDNDAYRLYNAAGELLWNTRGYPTPEGIAGARERLRVWLRVNPYTVVVAQEERKRAERRAGGVFCETALPPRKW